MITLNRLHRLRISFAATVGIALLAGCGKKSPESPAASATSAPKTATTPATPKIDKEVAAYYAARPEFFHFKTKADIPANLQWENGADLPELGSPNAKKGGTLNFFEPDYPRTLRIIGPDSNGSFRGWILDDNAMMLARRHPNVTSIGATGFHYYPGVAEAWALDRENKTVYVRIDPAARWSDGPPITSDDALFTFFFGQSKHIKGPWENNYYSTKFSGITRFDEKTFALHFPQVRPDIYGQALEQELVPKHFYDDFGEDYTERYQWKNVPTSGPYVINDKDLDKGRSVTLTRNKDWWARDKKFWRYRHNVDRIRLTVMRDTAKAFEAFKKGEIDFFGLQLAEYWYDKLPDSDSDVKSGYIHKSKFYNDIPRPNYGLWMNQSAPLLDNRDIRVGIQFASNWELVIEKFSRGDWGRMQTSTDGYGEFTNPNVRSRTYSVDKAVESFAKAGFNKRGPDGILMDENGRRLSVQVTTGFENLKDVLTILREEALKAGLELRLEVIDHTTAFKKALEKKHEIVFVGYNVSPEMIPRYWDFLHSSNAYDDAFLPDGSINPARKIKVQTNNITENASLEMDKIIDVYDRETDVAKLRSMSHKLQELVHDNAAFSPGFVTQFLRWGHWRWLNFPPDGNVKIATAFYDHSLYWVDEAAKKETLDARKSGQTFPVGMHTHEQYRRK